MNSLMMDEHTGSPEPTPAPGKLVTVTTLTPNPEPEPEAPFIDVPEEPKEEKKEIVLTELDRLKAENLSLRIQTLMFTREKFIAQANAKVGEYDQQIMELRSAIGVFQAELDKRYGIDFSKYAIEPGTGRVIPAPQS